MTNLIHFDGDLRHVADRYERFIGFLPFRTLRPDRCCLSARGGLDVLLAPVGTREIEGAN